MREIAERAHSDNRLPLAVLAFGIVCVSSAATLIRNADAAPLAVAAYRLGIASAALAPLALVHASRDIRALQRRDVVRIVLSGIALAVHFATWIASLELTSVASSVVIVTTNPLWVGLAAPAVLRETVPRRLYVGIAIAFVGGILIAWGDVRAGGSTIRGDALALVGAWAAATYFLIGRDVRRRVGLLAYVWLVYSIAAACLLAAAATTRTPMTGYSTETWACLVALALVPQILGHSSFNWALNRLSATFVSGAVLGEAIGSTLLAWWLLREAPPPATAAGGMLILVGLVVAARSERERLAVSAVTP